MRTGDAAHGELEACAPCLTRACLVDSVETFTQVRLVFAGNADPRVLYLQERLFIFHRCTHHDTTPLSIVCDGVVQQREDGLFEERRNTFDLVDYAGHHLDART